MTIYFLVLFILLLFAIVDFHYGGKKSKIKIQILYIVGFIIFIFAGLRWQTGTDWNNYFFYFRSVDQLEIGRTGFEFFYELLARIVKFIFGNYQFMLLITAVLIITFTYKTIGEFSPYPIFSVFLLYTYSLNSSGFGYRQDVAIAICIFSLYFIYKRNLKQFLLCVLIAFLFHQSALIFIPVYWIYKFKWNVKFIAAISLFTILFYFVFSRFEAFIGMIDPRLLYKLDLYDNESGSGFLGTAVGVLNRVVILIIPLLIIINNKHKDTVLLKGLLNIFIIGLILYFILSPLGPVFTRFTRYFDIFQILILPLSLFIANKNEKIVYLYLLLIFYVVKFVFVLISDQNLFVPYKSIFQFII